MSAPERYWKLRLQCGHKEDWFPACHGCLDEADASLADLRSQLEAAQQERDEAREVAEAAGREVIKGQDELQAERLLSSLLRGSCCAGLPDGGG